MFAATLHVWWTSLSASHAVVTSDGGDGGDGSATSIDTRIIMEVNVCLKYMVTTPVRIIPLQNVKLTTLHFGFHLSHQSKLCMAIFNNFQRVLAILCLYSIKVRISTSKKAKQSRYTPW
jgi:hypothetical protein